VSDQHELREVLVVDDAQDVLDVRAEIDFAIEEVPALTNARERRRIHLVTGFT